MVDRVVELEHLLHRCRALISNAGDGDWNRESGEWQLAAAGLLRDLDGLPAPEPFSLESDLTVNAAVMRSLGAASTCWTEIRQAGVFDSDRVLQVGAELLRWLRDRDRGEAAQVWPETDPEATQAIDAAAITSGVLMTPVGDSGRYAVSEPRYYGPGGEVSDPAQGARVEVSVEHGARVFDVDGRQVAPLTPEQQAAAMDPDGDLEGYDGPMGRPGGYCFGKDGEENRPGSHLAGGDPDCPRCNQWYSPERAAENTEVDRGMGR